MEFNLADIFESVADAVPNNVALVSGSVRRTFRELDERASRLAHYFLAKGIGHGDHVGLHLYNGHEYIEASFALWKIRATAININYRFVVPELAYMVRDANLKGILTHAEFVPLVKQGLAEANAELRCVVVMESDADVSSFGGDTYEAAVRSGRAVRDFEPRSGDDVYIVYTGGTTGTPKGVMWRHRDMFFAALQGGSPGGDPVDSPEQVAQNAADGAYTVTMLPCAPFIHGSAQFTALISMLTGGKVVVHPGKSFSAPDVLRLVKDEEVSTITIVGDAMAIPILHELDTNRTRYNVENLVVIASAGAILSPSIKTRLQVHLPDTMFVNSFGTSESGDMGRAADGEMSVDNRPTFYMDENVTVLNSDGSSVAPGSGEVGMLARTGYLPLGYYNDVEKTAERFREFGGKRWVVPGDLATVEADGRITFLGRGSKCINTGGEKVFPEEVEEALKAHASIIDALVVGVPDERWGSRVAAVFSVRGGTTLTLEEVQTHCRAHIAGYKVPRQITLASEVVRFPSGKPDYAWAENLARHSSEETAQ